MVIAYIPQTDTVTPGDVVETSGLGGMYPDGLVVGKVARVERKDADPFPDGGVQLNTADVLPAAAVTPIGASGTAAGVTMPDVPTGLEPALLVAATWKV